MSDALALSAVSFVLQYYLGSIYSGLSAEFGGHVRVSAVAPDIVQTELTGSTAPQNRVNLFLHQVTPNANWRNVGLPSLSADGSTRLKSPPLALDLHYLMTAYGSHNWHAEALLGYGLLMLHQNPIISRADITAAFSALPGYDPANPLSGFLGASGLADQLEMIKITPATLGREEMAWLWTALKADYRLTFPFQVSVVLITPPTASVFAFPVLSRNIQVQPSQSAQLLEVVLGTGITAPVSGDSVTVNGLGLAGATEVTLTNARLGVSISIPLLPADVTGESVTFTVPPDTAANPVPAGVYDLTVLISDSSGNPLQRTPSIPLAVAPTILTAIAGPSSVTETTITVTCSPNVFSVQSVSFIAGSTAAPAQPFTVPTGTLTFQFTPGLAAGTHVMRLQVDGIASAVTLSGSPPVFSDPTVTV